MGGGNCGQFQILGLPSIMELSNAIASRLPMVRPVRSPRVSKLRSRILVVEDELIVALLIEEMIRDAGYAISAIVRTVSMAHLELAKRNFDAVLLDINLDGEYHPELADLLLESGIPFAFMTGYDYLVEPRHETMPLLQKPFTKHQLADTLNTLVSVGSSTNRPLLGVKGKNPAPAKVRLTALRSPSP
jgi:CheY-like chemotaxis protein